MAVTLDCAVTWLGQVVDRLAARGLRPADPTPIPTTVAEVSVQPNKAQRRFSALDAHDRWLSLLQDSPPVDRARIRSASEGGASLWIAALPSAPCFILSDDAVVVAGRDRLGVPLAGPGWPCSCGERAPSACHLMTCSTHGGKPFRHSSLCAELALMVMHAGIPSRLEPRGLLDSARGGPDLLLRDGPRQVLYDLTVVDPRAATHLASGSAEEPLQAIADATAAKDASYRAPAEARGYRFHALPIEVFGAFSPQLRRLLRELSKRLGGCLPDGVSPTFAQHTVYQYWSTRLACVLVRANAKWARHALTVGARGQSVDSGFPASAAPFFYFGADAGPDHGPAGGVVRPLPSLAPSPFSSSGTVSRAR